MILARLILLALTLFSGGLGRKPPVGVGPWPASKSSTFSIISDAIVRTAFFDGSVLEGIVGEDMVGGGGGAQWVTPAFLGFFFFFFCFPSLLWELPQFAPGAVQPILL
jgi:hypothetical protein